MWLRQTAGAGHFQDLLQRSFTLLDNGVPQKIVSFAASNQQPTDENERLAEVVLVLDEVDLSPEQLELVKERIDKVSAAEWRTSWSTHICLLVHNLPDCTQSAAAHHRRQRLS